MKKYILFFFIGILLFLEHLDTQTALQTKVDVTVTAVVSPSQHSIQMTNSSGKQINTIVFVQNVSPDNSTDVQTSQFDLNRGNGLPALKISQGYTEMNLDQNSINYSNGATGAADLQSTHNLGTNIQNSFNTITSTVTTTDYSNTAEVATAYPVLTVSWDKFILD